MLRAMAVGWPAVNVDQVRREEERATMSFRAQPEAGSLEWWLLRLGKELDRRQGPIQRLLDYYHGRHQLLYASRRFREAFGGLFSTWSDNFCALVVDSVAERLEVEGFRFPAEKGASPEQLVENDASAWELWQRSGMDADAHLGQLSSLITGCGYVIVGPGNGGPQITVEDERQVVAELEPGSSRVRRAAMKRWAEDDGTLRAVLYLPDGIYKFRSRDVMAKQGGRPWADAVWLRWEPQGEPWPVPWGITVGGLPSLAVIPLRNRPWHGGEFESELEQVIPVQDGVNKLVADMLVAAEFAAFRQRWATGLDVPIDPVTGQELEPFKAAVDRLWTVPPVPVGEQPTAFGEFSATDLRPYVAAIEMLVQHLSSRTRTPPHYLLSNTGSLPSGESLKSAETGLVKKTVLKMRPLGGAWEEAVRLGWALTGQQQLADRPGLEAIWRNPESRSQAEVTDAALKMQALGVPTEALWEYMGFTPAQRARFRTLRAAEALEVAAAFDPLTAAAQVRQPQQVTPGNGSAGQLAESPNRAQQG